MNILAQTYIITAQTRLKKLKNNEFGQIAGIIDACVAGVNTATGYQYPIPSAARCDRNCAKKFLKLLKDGYYDNFPAP